MTTWQTIDTAPRDGTKIVCWSPQWSVPLFLIFKTNRRIVHIRITDPNSVKDMDDSYFGDPYESDDYGFAKQGFGPTHWHPLEPTPNVGEATTMLDTPQDSA